MFFYNYGISFYVFKRKNKRNAISYFSYHFKNLITIKVTLFLPQKCLLCHFPSVLSVSISDLPSGVLLWSFIHFQAESNSSNSPIASIRLKQLDSINLDIQNSLAYRHKAATSGYFKSSIYFHDTNTSCTVNRKGNQKIAPPTAYSIFTKSTYFV